MAEQPSAGMGAVVRHGAIADLASAAGFSTVEDLPIEHPMLRFYRLRP
jgi:hypothetical protein